MYLKVIGTSHKTAPIDIRETFFLSVLERELLLYKLKLYPCISGAFIISTCNRIEIYVSSITQDLDRCIVLDLLWEVKKINLPKHNQDYFYDHSGDSALNHLLRVATGLDSLVLGEAQILGQVKESFQLSQKLKMLDRYLNLLHRITVTAGKLAQRETNIGWGGTSVAWAAVNLAEKYYQGLDGKKVILLGSGQMASLAARQLKIHALKDFYIMNRTKEKAVQLANESSATPVSFLDVPTILKDVDFCICAVNAPHYIVDKETVASFIENRDKELLFIDISMPRNVDPGLAVYNNTKLFTIDDLGETLEISYRRRQSSIRDVDAIITRKVKEFNQKWIKMEYYDNSIPFNPSLEMVVD